MCLRKEAKLRRPRFPATSAMSLVIKTHLKIDRAFNGRGRVVAHTSSQHTCGDRMLLYSGVLQPADGDAEVELSTEVHGPGITWSHGDRHVSLSLGEGREHAGLEMHFLMERTVLPEGGEGLRGDGESRNRTAASGLGEGVALHRPEEGAAALAGGSVLFN